MSKTLIVLSLIFTALGAQAATKLETCMVVEKLGGTRSVDSTSYDLQDNLSSPQKASLKLLKDLEITLAAGPGVWDSDSHKLTSVVADIKDIADGIAFNSIIVVINETNADEVGRNMSHLDYARKNGDVVQVNCAMVER